MRPTKKKAPPTDDLNLSARLNALCCTLLNHLEARLEQSAVEPITLKPRACRYCWGIGHAYQWKTRREYQEALIHGDLDDLNLTEAGGFGFRSTLGPNPVCPECEGLGPDDRISQVLRLFPAHALDRIRSLDVSDRAIRLSLHGPNDLFFVLVRVALARNLQMQNGEPEDSFAAALKAISARGSSAPIKGG